MLWFRQLATRYLLTWLGLWLVVLLASVVAPCCETLAAPDTGPLLVHSPSSEMHHHAGAGHHEPASTGHSACDLMAVNAINAPLDSLGSQYRFNHEPVKTIPDAGAMGPVSRPVPRLVLQSRELDIPGLRSLYLVTQRLRI
jgi:hypothetical protein